MQYAASGGGAGEGGGEKGGDRGGGDSPCRDTGPPSPDRLQQYTALVEDDLWTNEPLTTAEQVDEKTNKFKKIFKQMKKSFKLNCLQWTE